MTRHPQAEVLEAIANGKQCQIRSSKYKDSEYEDASASTMLICLAHLDAYDLRVKPEPKPDVVLYDFVRGPESKYKLQSLEDAKRFAESSDQLVKLTFSGDDGKLKTAEVIA